MSRLAALAILASSVAAGCLAEPEDDADLEIGEDALAQKADEHWLYTGPMPVLEAAKVFVSLQGHTARVSGLLPAGARVPDLPHVRAQAEGARTRLDVVYPIATAAYGVANSVPGREYGFEHARPYRPDGMAYPRSDPGGHWVTWGGFPFLAYNGGIAFHGPITPRNSRGRPDMSVWYLQRGKVSAGCNRMMGEHVVEMSHMLGISMRKIYGENQMYWRPTAAKVLILADYDRYGDKYIDVDYPTDVGAPRPAATHGREQVEMFGSWVATETPDGRDLPPDMKWRGGVSGAYYVFAEHARRDMVCSYAKRDLTGLKNLARHMGGELPRSICEKKACVEGSIRAGRSSAQTREACAL
jgi:hypothetical protein